MSRPAIRSILRLLEWEPTVLRVMLHFLREPDVQAVAVCDVNKTGANYPQWEMHEFCNSVSKLLSVDSGWDWLSPEQPLQLSHSLAVTSGVAGREPCQKIVDGYYGTHDFMPSSSRQIFAKALKVCDPCRPRSQERAVPLRFLHGLRSTALAYP